MVSRLQSANLVPEDIVDCWQRQLNATGRPKHVAARIVPRWAGQDAPRPWLGLKVCPDEQAPTHAAGPAGGTPSSLAEGYRSFGRRIRKRSCGVDLPMHDSRDSLVARPVARHASSWLSVPRLSVWAGVVFLAGRACRGSGAVSGGPGGGGRGRGGNPGAAGKGVPGVAPAREVSRP